MNSIILGSLIVLIITAIIWISARHAIRAVCGVWICDEATCVKLGLNSFMIRIGKNASFIYADRIEAGDVLILEDGEFKSSIRAFSIPFTGRCFGRLRLGKNNMWPERVSIAYNSYDNMMRVESNGKLYANLFRDVIGSYAIKNM